MKTVRDREADEVLAVEIAATNAIGRDTFTEAMMALDAWLLSGLSYIESTEGYYDAE